MAPIPQSILDVVRPENTVVIDSGGYSIHRFIVRRRATAEERTLQPNSKYKETVGHIIDGVFVPKEDQEVVSSETPYMVSFGAAIPVLSSAIDTFDNLKNAFHVKTALNITTLACLKVMYPDITEHTMGRKYLRNYIPVFFPGVDISKNKISKLYNMIGLDKNGRQKYYNQLISQLTSNDIVYVDGILIQDTSSENFLSAKSYKKLIDKHDVIFIVMG